MKLSMLFFIKMQINDTAKEFKLRQDFENRVKELQKQLDVKEKEIETISFQFNNAKEQMKLFESTINEQKVSITAIKDLFFVTLYIVSDYENILMLCIVFLKKSTFL